MHRRERGELKFEKLGRTYFYFSIIKDEQVIFHSLLQDMQAKEQKVSLPQGFQKYLSANNLKANTATGIYVGTITTTALSSLLMLTPYGWFIAIGVRLYVGFTASIKMNNFMKQTSENIYDRKPIFEGVF
ncbi:hypothetical protein WNY79_15865 [Pseudoalteromonas sp. AS84]|jgi:hypothetical protein|uniref:hypothetical protein n=1 Tax=Pseudoalteromonas sp. AS84 TaxID=3135778 RepID=UPI003173BC6D